MTSVFKIELNFKNNRQSGFQPQKYIKRGKKLKMAVNSIKVASRNLTKLFI